MKRIHLALFTVAAVVAITAYLAFSAPAAASTRYYSRGYTGPIVVPIAHVSEKPTKRAKARKHARHLHHRSAR